MAHGKNQNFGWVDPGRFTFDVVSIGSDFDFDLAMSELTGSAVDVSLASHADLHGHVDGSNTMVADEREVRLLVATDQSDLPEVWTLRWTRRSGSWTALNETELQLMREPRTTRRGQRQRR